MTAPPLAFAGAGKTLAGRPVLSEVTFDCPAGQITALLGPNGAGKTTSVALATGLRAPDTGQVRVFGRTARDRTTRSRLSLVPQEVGLPAAVTVRRCLAFVAGQRQPGQFTPPRDELCERLGLGPLLARRVGGLSGGQQRRVAVALGLLHAPPLLILDEATTNLDETARTTTWELIGSYAERGGAVLVTTHILADIDSHADRVVALSAGTVVLQSPLAQVRARLGGSAVSIRVPSSRRAEVLARTASCVPEAIAVPGSTADALAWRTPAPLPLVTALAVIAPEATDLLVGPVPLGDLLPELATESTR